MTRRGRLILVLAIGIPAAILIVSGVVVYLVLRTIDSKPAPPATAAAAFDEVRRSFPPRPPLVEVIDLRRAQVRVNRTPSAPRKPVGTLHFLIYDPADQGLTRGSVPAWVTRMRVSLTGIGNWSFSDLHVTTEDIERYAPGLVVDFTTPDGEQVLVWAR